MKKRLDCQSFPSVIPVLLIPRFVSTLFLNGWSSVCLFLPLPLSHSLSFVRSGKTHRSNDGVTAMVGNKVLDGAGGCYVEAVATDEM